MVLYAKTHPEMYMHKASRTNAKVRGIEFSITSDDIQITEFCPVLGIKLKSHVGSGQRGPRPDSPSLDRLDSSKGYVSGNVWVISARANAMKSNSTPEQLLAFADWVKRTYSK